MSALNEPDILGRDAVKQEIMNIVSASHNKDGAMVFSIYGLGGVGKTTMLQLVFNDTKSKQYYEKNRVWVHVPEVFDLKKIGMSIISQLSGNEGHQNLDTLEMINRRLEELLSAGKKVLIVLDDLWQEDGSELDRLKNMLHLGKEGSMVHVLVTTRSESIAKQICTSDDKSYHLQALADSVCWDIIKMHNKHRRIQPRHEKIALDFAKKCGGLPLAARALGYVLKSKDPDSWSEIYNRFSWNEPTTVLPSLRLSYEQLVPELQSCFRYCAIFPKGHDICAGDLVHQWLALNLIKNSSEGKEYIDKLLGMSFLQHSKLPTISGKNVMYTMHDLVHELARSVSRDDLIVIDAAGNVNISEQKDSKYALLINYDGQTELSDILPKKVQALHFSSTSKLPLGHDSFSFANCLHILDFSECSDIVLPSSIGQLKQLKCLIAPKLQNTSLPTDIGKLANLQYLNLRESSLISALPEPIGELSCLIYLGLSGCSGILEIPDSFGGLKSLVHLDMSNCSGITVLPDSLGNLTKLQHLDLSRCTGVKKIPESLGGLNQLRHLNLSYCDSISSLPEAIGSLNNLQYLDLQWNSQIRELPGSFQNLKNLLHLYTSGCRCVKGLPEGLHGLTSLEHLKMYDFKVGSSSWKVVFDAMENLTNLKYLEICDSGIDCCVDFISILTNLEHLDLSCNSGIVSLPECIGNLNKLHTLDLSGCENLGSLPDSIGNLNKLHTLDLSGCGSLGSLPDSIGNLKRLHTLDLSSCAELKSLPGSISKIAALKCLLIDECSDELIEMASSVLPYSVTLPLFMVRADVASSCSNLPLLEGTDVAELRICSLENVWSLEEARKFKLLDKDKLSYLALIWTSLDASRSVDDEDLLGELKPPRTLRTLGLEFYNGQSFPTWFMDIPNHLPNLVSISLTVLPKCNKLPPFGQLPNLEALSLNSCYGITKIDKDFCGGNGAFHRLTRFYLINMDRLEEWCTTYSVDGVDHFMFPKLDTLWVQDCPMLRLTSCPPVCHNCTILGSDRMISSLEEMGNNIRHCTFPTPTTKLTIFKCYHESLLRLLDHFTALKYLEFSFCDLMSLPESMRHITSLQELNLKFCNSISEMPEWLVALSSLESLTIKGCEGIKSLPPCIQQLTKLQMLWIENNPELKLWCESEENKEKLAHIRDLNLCEEKEPAEHSSEEDEQTEHSSEEDEPTEHFSEEDETDYSTAEDEPTE